MTDNNRTPLETRALRYLARREHTRHELERKLSDHAHSPQSQQLVADLLDRLEQDGYLSTQRFAEHTVRTRRTRFGSQRIIRELKEKGVDEQVIAEVLPDLKVTDFETARQIWQKKFGAPPADSKERAKHMRFMMGRGFSMDTVNAVLSQAKQEET